MPVVKVAKKSVTLSNLDKVLTDESHFFEKQCPDYRPPWVWATCSYRS